MQSGKQMHESPEYDALIFRPDVSLSLFPFEQGQVEKKKEGKRKKERVCSSRKRTGNEAIYISARCISALVRYSFEKEGKNVIIVHIESRRISQNANCIKYFSCIWIRAGIPTGVRWKLAGHNCAHIYEKPALDSDPHRIGR